jgi:hypothetical protein
MFRPAVWLIIFLLLMPAWGCGRKSSQLARPTKMAVVVVADEEGKRLAPEDTIILQQVVKWLERDIGRRLRDRGLEAALLPNMKSYTAASGPLLIITIDSFVPGIAANQPYRQASGLPSAIIASYKLQDEKGGVAAQWQDGAESIKGATYCARTLNIKAVDRIAAYFQER